MSLPSGYTRLEYIESTGTQYIDTGFNPNNNTRVVLDFEPTAAYSSIVGIFGIRDTSSGTAANMFVFWNNGANTFRTDYFGTQKTMTVSTLLARQTVDKDKNLTTIGSVSASNTASTGQCSNNLYLFCTNNAGTANYFAKLKLYSCQIYDNGTLIRDYIPCQTTSGVAGLWDDVNSQFYQNAKTGSFIAGEMPKGTHKTLVNGTVYEVKGGKCLVNGTSYDIKKGRTLINGTGEDIVLSSVSPILDENDWATIREVSDAGQGSNYWSIGDRKAVTLNGTVGKISLSNVTTYAFIIGFNHNASVEGANRIHFQLAKTALSGGKDVALCDSRYNTEAPIGYFLMNTGYTNAGGWKSSQMRTNICGTSLSSYSGTIIAVIPAALRAVLKSVTKYTDNTANGGGSTASYVTATTDYFFLLSEYEVFGSISHANSNESSKQAQYAYYSAGNSKIKYKHNGTSTAANWWLRSPRAIDSGRFVRVGTKGTVDADGADYSLGFAPGFCV